MPKSSLTFFFGTKKPFIQLDGSCKKKNKYIILPWNINTAIGKDNLRNMINKIPSKGKSLIYTIYVSDENKNTIKNTLEDSINTFRDLSLSQASFQDDTDKLYDKIDELNKKLKILEEKLTNAEAEIKKEKEVIKQKRININSLNQQIQNSKQLWTALLPNRIGILNCSVAVGDDGARCVGIKNKLEVQNISGNIILDVSTRTLTIDAPSCQSIVGG